MHIVKGLVNTINVVVMCDELINLDLASKVVLNNTRKLGSALDTAKGTALPDTASNELERSSLDDFTGSSDTNNDRLTPAFVAGLEGRAHNVDVTCAVESEVKAAVGHLNKLLLNRTLVLGGVDKMGSTKFLGPLLLLVVDINNIDGAGLAGSSTLDNGKTDTASTKNSNVVAFLDIGSDGGSTITSSDTTAKQTDLVKIGLFVNGDNRDVGNDSVLGKGRASHKVEQFLATGFESASSVGHHTFALCGTDSPAKIGFSRQAELALAALSSVQGDDVVAGLDVGNALANALNNTSALMSKNDGESAFGILARQCVGISMADASGDDLDSHLVGTRRKDLDVFNRERLAGFPSNSSFTCDCFSNSIGHGFLVI